jgi:hypothetical protein
MFGDHVRQIINQTQESSDTASVQPTEPIAEMSPATRALIEELSSLLPAGSAAATIDGGIFPPADPNAQRVMDLLAGSVPMIRNEVAGGLQITRDAADALLTKLVAQGMVIIVDIGDRPHFTVPQELKPPPQPEQPYISPERKWSDAAAARERQKAEALQPKSTPRYEPTDAEVAEAMAKQTVKPLTPEEQREYDRLYRNRRAINPQAYVKR